MGGVLDKSLASDSTHQPDARVRVRLNLNTSQPCYNHLRGKSDKEVRAWAEMALNYVAAQLDHAASAPVDVTAPSITDLPKQPMVAATPTVEKVPVPSGSFLKAARKGF